MMDVYLASQFSWNLLCIVEGAEYGVRNRLKRETEDDEAGNIYSPVESRLLLW
jgi:hypothetical protein